MAYVVQGLALLGKLLHVCLEALKSLVILIAEAILSLLEALLACNKCFVLRRVSISLEREHLMLRRKAA